MHLFGPHVGHPWPSAPKLARRLARSLRGMCAGSALSPLAWPIQKVLLVQCQHRGRSIGKSDLTHFLLPWCCGTAIGQANTIAYLRVATCADFASEFMWEQTPSKIAPQRLLITFHNCSFPAHLYSPIYGFDFLPENSCDGLLLSKHPKLLVCIAHAFSKRRSVESKRRQRLARLCSLIFTGTL